MPEPFLSICPHCRAKLKLKDPALIGKVARCPACQEKFTVSRSASAAKAAPAGSPTQAPKAAPARQDVRAAGTTAGKPAPAGQAGPKGTAAAAAPGAVKPKSKPKPPPADDELDPWLSDDLGDFEAGDTAVASGKTAVPPPVRGVSKKRKPTGEAPAKKRKRRSASAGQVSWIGWLVGGGVAGAIGASVWAAIAAFTFREWGILAWALGGFVGFGVRIGARDDDVGIAPGLTALGIAVVAVILGKFLAVHFMLASFENMIEEAAAQAQVEQAEAVEISDEEALDMAIAEIAGDIELEWEDQGREWQEPDYDNIPDDAPNEAYYDPVIWTEAKQRWEARPAEERTQIIAEYKSGELDLAGDFGELKKEMFAASFGLLDVLFFFLAAGTAFKVGSGLDFGDD